MYKQPTSKEATSLREMDSANVAKVVRFLMRTDTGPYMVIHTGSEVTLLKYVRGQHLDRNERNDLYRQMALSVEYLHGHSMVHCHINPEAFFVTQQGKVRADIVWECTIKCNTIIIRVIIIPS